MLGSASPTPLDLRFSVFGIPVRVHPFFWLFSLLMGWDPDDPNFMFLWVACVFVSILVHELGHALTARYFGWPPEIVLYTFGGYASFLPAWGYTTRRAIVVLLAGPFAGFALFGIVWCLDRLVFRGGVLPPDVRHLRYLPEFFFQMEFINLWWGLVNLLPVYPLDGGQISRHLFTHFRPHDGLDISLKLSLLAGGAVAVYFFMHDRSYAGILFALLALENLQNLQGMRYR